MNDETVRRSRSEQSLWRAALLAALLSSQLASADDGAAAGASIYRTGLRPDGTPVAATVQRDVPLPPGTGACASCHRRSGIGFSEGGTARSLNLTAPALFARLESPPRRPAYDDASLAAAIITGVAADGRVLDSLMPRYQLTNEDAQALIAYLHTLGAAPSPGVTESELGVATIVSSDTPDATKQAITAVLQRFVDIMNADTRREDERAEAARRHAYGRNYQRSHRDWDFSIWELTGPASGWRAQLEARYADDTPFVVISGSTGHDWSIVHDFCEAKAMPCVLPIVDNPPIDPKAFYSVYYSAGVTLDANVTARHIQNEFSPLGSLSLLLLHVDNEKGRAAQRAFSAYLADSDLDLTIIAVPAASQPRARDWQQLLFNARPDILIGWLDDRALQGLFGIADQGLLPQTIYTSERFGTLAATSMLPEAQARIRHVFPYRLPETGQSRYPREDAWLRMRDLTGYELVPAAQALFAAHIVGEALSDMQTNFSRDYLLETLEHGLDGTQMTTVYPNTTIGPGQRFISPGAYVTRLGARNRAERFVDTVWIQP